MFLNWSLSGHPKCIIRFVIFYNMNDFGPVGIYEFFSVERAFSGGLVAGLYPQNPLVHYQAIAYRIYDLKIGTRTSFSLVIWFSPFSIIPPLLHTFRLSYS